MGKPRARLAVLATGAAELTNRVADELDSASARSSAGCVHSQCEAAQGMSVLQSPDKVMLSNSRPVSIPKRKSQAVVCTSAKGLPEADIASLKICSKSTLRLGIDFGAVLRCIGASRHKDRRK